MAELIPQNFIDDLVQRIDVVEVIGSRIEIKKAGKEYKGLCPFHTEKTPSFTVSQDKGFYHCFGCGAHGTALGFLIDVERLRFVEAIEELEDRIASLETKDAHIENEMRTIMSDHENIGKALEDLGKGSYSENRQYGNYGE